MSVADLPEDVKPHVESWLRLDPNPTTKAEVEKLVADGNVEQLRKIMCKRISFGTAGLRSRMGAGYANMNDLIILQTSQGLVRWLEARDSEAAKKGFVIGYDARYHSREFAEITADVFVSAGFKVHLYSRTCATPLVPFSILEVKAAAGVMITASHNPKDDNGYKVYLPNSAQIIPPYDAEISDSISKNFEPWTSVKVGAWKDSDLVVDPTDACSDAYFAAIKQYSASTPAANAEGPVKVVYTAMHGVGTPWVKRAMKEWGLPDAIPVKEQVEEDPDFPTVAFPNPEEGKGALKLAFETADAAGARLVLANDPDADRLAVAEKPEGASEWKIFTGNEIALLFADWVWRNHMKANPDCDKSKELMLASTVSSKVLKAMATAEGFEFRDTLTGFKWMGNEAHKLEQEGFHFLFAYEVEIGFLVGNISLDKDGVRTLAVWNELANDLARKGSNLTAHCESLYQKYGYHEMSNRYFYCYKPETMKTIFDRLRTLENGSYPSAMGAFEITAVRDLTTGYDSNYEDKKARMYVTASSQMITFTFKNGGTLTLRGSGTEPKLKYYVEVVDKESRAAAQKLLQEMVATMISEFLQPEKNDLVPPKDS